MKQFIACCGIDCETCDARIATVNDDNELREKTAQKWSEMYGSPDITPESINCMGCRIDGVKIGHYNECGIQKCVHEKGYNTCGECAELDTCEMVGMVLQHLPEAKVNLLSV
jgi:hypothetical protein